MSHNNSIDYPSNIVICIGGIRDREGRRREGGGGSSTFDLLHIICPL